MPFPKTAIFIGLIAILASTKPLAWEHSPEQTDCREIDEEWYQPGNCGEWNFLGDVIFSAGYRQDKLSLSVEGPTDASNNLSKVQWTGLDIWEIKGQFDLLLCNRIYIRGYTDYGKIYHGHNRESDFGGKNGSRELSRTKATSDRGEVFDFSGGIGYQFHFGDWFGLLDTDWTLSPMAGYSYHEQHIQDRNGVQIINRRFSEAGEEIPLGSLGPFPGHHNKYRSKWKGPWAGVDTCLLIGCNWELFGSFEYHWAHYHAVEHYNLKKEITKDFRQKADKGNGYLLQAGTCYDFWRAGFVRLTFTYQWMRSGSGEDRTFFKMGHLDRTFKGADWHTWSILADLGWIF